MPLGPNKLPYVSFVFSCEIAGKAILGTSDASDAQAVSALSAEAPVVVQASKPVVISPEDALAKHAEFMREYTRKQRKSAGVDSDEDVPDLVAHPELRRHSTRVPKPVLRNDEPDAPEEDGDFALSDGGGSVGRKRKQVHNSIAAAQLQPGALDSADMDAASRAEIERLLAADSGMAPRKRGGGRPKKAPKTPSPRKGKLKKQAESEDAMSDIDEQGEEEEESKQAPRAPAAAAPAASNANNADIAATSSDDDDEVQEISPLKKRKIASPQVKPKPAPSSVPSPRKSPAKAGAAAAKHPPAKAAAKVAADNSEEDDFLSDDDDGPAAGASVTATSDDDSVELVSHIKVSSSVKKPTNAPPNRRPVASLQPRPAQSSSNEFM